MFLELIVRFPKKGYNKIRDKKGFSSQPKCALYLHLICTKKVKLSIEFESLENVNRTISPTTK